MARSAAAGPPGAGEAEINLGSVGALPHTPDGWKPGPWRGRPMTAHRQNGGSGGPLIQPLTITISP